MVAVGILPQKTLPYQLSMVGTPNMSQNRYASEKRSFMRQTTYTITLVVGNGLSFLFGASSLAQPGAYGATSLFLLVSLGMLTFMDIWAVHQMKEQEALKAAV